MMKMNVPKELSDALQRSEMDKGDRGEMVAMLLFIQAYDAAREDYETKADSKKLHPAVPLVALLNHLLASFGKVDKMLPTYLSQSNQDLSLGQSFDRSKVYFNHFARIHSSTVLNQKYLPGFVRRGAAILCVAGQAAVDLCIPFIHKDDQPLTEENIGMIYVQVKNSGRYGAKPHLNLFAAMDPYALGVLDGDSASRAPIVRLVFALAAAESVAKVIPLPPTCAPTVSRFTAFDIWCAGTSQKTFSIIQSESTRDLYRLLLEMSQRINDAFVARTNLPSETFAVMARRGMLPFATANAAHWERFFDVAADAMLPGQAAPPPAPLPPLLPKRKAVDLGSNQEDEDDAARPPAKKRRSKTKGHRSAQSKQSKKAAEEAGYGA